MTHTLRHRGDRRSMFLPFPLTGRWVCILDGDDAARELFDRHYSRYHYVDGRKPKLFVGPGEKLVLTTADRRALFVWRKFISADGQLGINCAVFRNESDVLSSELIAEADALADARWPGERHFTYVDPRQVASTNPGYCFIRAGWQRCGVTKTRKLLILERAATDVALCPGCDLRPEDPRVRGCPDRDCPLKQKRAA